MGEYAKLGEALDPVMPSAYEMIENRCLPRIPTLR